MALDYEKLGAFYLGREWDADRRELAQAPLLYDARDLTTHAVCVGMTGSGKTGLCLTLLEEAAIDGIPAICIDPKGDIGNLALAFPALAAADFAPWVDAGEAARKGLSVDAHAEAVAAQWRTGLAEWDQPPERVQRFRDAADVAIYTPGADEGLQLSLLRSFDAPPPELHDDAEALAEKAGAVASGLLTLLGRDADPLQSRDHILLANLLARAWSAGQGLDLAALVGLVQKPPFDRLGALDLETFHPAKDRMALALALNGLLASPRLAAWTRGEPLDVQRLLYTPEGRPRIAVMSIAHLGDDERMFFVTLLLEEIIGWMRRQPGTSSLRAILYMDEIFGFFPPTANPPSKVPMLTLLKQARAHGLGCVLATQNPVDLDYKGLGNAGTWLIGRLSTERDRDRLAAGLAGAAGNLDRDDLATRIAALEPRTFLLRNVHDEAPVLFRSRWALSYLRGPITGTEIRRLVAGRKSADAAAAAVSPAVGATPATPAAPTATSAAPAAPAAPGGSPGARRPPLPDGVQEYFMPADAAAACVPRVVAAVKLHFVERRHDVDAWQSLLLAAPFADDGRSVLWEEAVRLDCTLGELAREPRAGAVFAELPAAAQRATSYAKWGKALAGTLYQHERLALWTCDEAGLVSAPGETAGDFRVRVDLALREQRDAAVAKLRAKYAPKLRQLEAQLQRARDRSERERDQLSQQKTQAAVSLGAAIVGAFLGRKVLSAGNVGRAGSAVRSASRVGRESGDVARAEESEAVAAQRLEALAQELEAEVAALRATQDAAAVALEQVTIPPRKSDITLVEVALLWQPSGT